MVYAYDRGAQLPVMDIYDTGMMQIAINAAKDIYEKEQQEMKDFTELYGNFMSPFAKDMTRYGEMVGNVKDTIDRLYAAGIDPLRSAEGRAIISRLTRSINPAEFNTMRTNAKLGFDYLEAVQKAKARNEFDQSFENYTLSKANGGPGLFDEFSSAGGNMWNRPGPYTYQDLNTMVSPLFENMKDEYIESDDQYDYSGVSRDRRAAVLSANLGSILNTVQGRYHYEESKKRAAALLGRTPTEQEALQQYQNDLLDASNRFEHRDRTENKDYARRAESKLRREEDTVRTSNDIYAEREKEKIRYATESLKLKDLNRDGVVSAEEQKYYDETYGTGGGPAPDKNHDIILDSQRSPGTTKTYNPSDPFTAKIAPVDGRIRFYGESKKGSDDAIYMIPNDVAESVLFRYEDGKAVKMSRAEMLSEEPSFWQRWLNTESALDYESSKESVSFVPAGNVITLEENGVKQTYMFGTINATGETVLMKVKRNVYNYNK